MPLQNFFLLQPISRQQVKRGFSRSSAKVAVKDKQKGLRKLVPQMPSQMPVAGLLSILERRYNLGIRVLLQCTLAAITVTCSILDTDVRAFWLQQQKVPLTTSVLCLGLAWGLLALDTARCLLARQAAGVFLIDFSVFPIPKELKMTREETLDRFAKGAEFTQESLENHRRVMFSPALQIGDATALGPGLSLKTPLDTSLQTGLEELKMTSYKAVQDALASAGIKPCEVDILLTTSNMIVPLPSFSAMIANKFGMRSDLISYSLGGQGCCAGVMIMGLAQSLLKVAPSKVALVVIHENTTRGFSPSNSPYTHTSNCLFRLNGAAVVLSSRPQDRARAKYALLHTERTLLTSDVAFNSIQAREDEEGILGVFLRKRDLTAAAVKAIDKTLRKMAPLVLPLPELLRALVDKAYKPNLGLCIDHILIHTGAVMVITSVAEALCLRPEAAAPSSETLTRFGNTSGCSTYYILANIESKGGVKAGERVLQLGFGSGFKCAAAYWKALRNVQTRHAAWDPCD